MTLAKRTVYIVSAGFFGLFLAFSSAQGLATSLNGDLGTICLAALYIVFTLACIPAPKLVNYLGPKNSMIIGAVPYLLMVLSFLNPGWYTSLPAHALVGVGASILWSSQGIIIGRSALAHAKETNKPVSAVTSAFNSLFYTFYNLNGMSGLALSALVLTLIGDGPRDILYIILSALGALGIIVLFWVPNEQPVSTSSTSDSIADTSLLHAEVFENDITPFDSSISINETVPTKDATAGSNAVPDVTVLDTLKLIVSDGKMSLLIPILIYSGMSYAFLVGDYTRYAGTKMLGPNFTSMILAIFYLSNSISTYISGKAAGTGFGRWGLIIVGSLSHILFLLFFCMWDIPENYQSTTVDGKTEHQQLVEPLLQHYIFAFVGAIFFAIGDSVWHAQLPAILQTFYTESRQKTSAAMANLKLFQSMGNALQFVIGLLLQSQINLKMYILAIVLTFGFCGVMYLHTTHTSIDQQPESTLRITNSINDDANAYDVAEGDDAVLY